MKDHFTAASGKLELGLPFSQECFARVAVLIKVLSS